jgi:DNA polymerase III alpha subunit
VTDEGLRNLWRLNDAAAQEKYFHHVGRNSWDHFERFGEGIVFTSACALSLVSKGILKGDYSAANRYLETFKDNFYIELSTYPGDEQFFDKDSDEPTSPRELNLALYEWAQERGVGVVYGDDGHYAFPDQYEAHDAYVARSTGDSIYTPIRRSQDVPPAWGALHQDRRRGPRGAELPAQGGSR